MRLAREEHFVRLWRARSFSFACPKEKYPRENDTPAWRLPGIPARQVREPGPGPAGLSSPTHRRAEVPGRAARHPGLTRTRCATAAQ